MPVENQDPSKEGTVDWDAAKEFFTGKEKSDAEGAQDDAAGADGAAQEPQLVEVSIKGRKIKVSAADAAAIEDFRREVRERDGRLGGENAQLKERLARLEGIVEAGARPSQTPKTELTPPPASLAHEDFAEWQRQYDRYHAAKMAEMAADLERRYESERDEERAQARKAAEDQAWANKFYADYDHLDSPHLKGVVQSVYTRHARSIHAAGEVEEQHARLAELVDEALVELKTAGKTATPTNKPPRLEGGSAPTPSRRPAVEDRQPITAASWVAQKRKALRGGK